MTDENLIALADSFMGIFGYKRKAIVRGNVIEPVFEIKCDICGDHHSSYNIPYGCQTGDGI
jgi:hypothetical protein